MDVIYVWFMYDYGKDSKVTCSLCSILSETLLLKVQGKIWKKTFKRQWLHECLMESI